MDQKKDTNLDESSNTIDIGNWPTIKELERSYLFKVLRYTKGKKSKAAAIMGISLQTFYKKFNSYYKENTKSLDNKNSINDDLI